MNKILQATIRGQVTLPKAWRDKFGTQYFMAEIREESLVIKPVVEAKTFKGEVENSWKEYKKGDYTDAEDLKKKYGL